MFFPIFVPDHEIERRRKFRERLEQDPIDFDPLKTKWQPELPLRAETYEVPSLFQVTPSKNRAVHLLEESEYVDSPGGNWRYSEVILPAGTKVSTWAGSRIGEVMFDGDILIPKIHRRSKTQTPEQIAKYGVRWSSDPIMSLTPAEIMSMRVGRDHARRHTAVCGLGMGYLLEIIATKRTVKELTLIELDQDIIDFILTDSFREHIESHVDVFRVFCANAQRFSWRDHEVAPDAVIVDIHDHYGGNTFHNFPRCAVQRWVWGSAPIADRWW